MWCQGYARLADTYAGLHPHLRLPDQLSRSGQHVSTADGQASACAVLGLAQGVACAVAEGLALVQHHQGVARALADGICKAQVQRHG